MEGVSDKLTNQIRRISSELLRSEVRRGKESLCVRCRGSKLLCGLSTCPILSNYFKIFRNEVNRVCGSKIIHGSSPPSIFVGRFGYPKVYVGPLVPPLFGDTSIFDFPEKWTIFPFIEILRFRTLLVHGRTIADVKFPERLGRIYDLMTEMILSEKPVETEMELQKRPIKLKELTMEVSPTGPSAPLEKLKLATTKTDFKLEKIYYDFDLKASEAIVRLYEEKVPVSRIQKALSAGMLGVKKRRSLVPTRWSITAVDSVISEWLLEKVREYPVVNYVEVYIHEEPENLFVALLVPNKWEYEWLEAWFPGTVWNKFGKDVVIYADYERYKGRTNYAENTGGCYYAARLAVAEKLFSMRRQAKAILFREVYRGYFFPVGVWNVREGFREAFKKEAKKFEDLGEALSYIMTKLRVDFRKWLRKSVILWETVSKKITDFMRRELV